MNPGTASQQCSQPGAKSRCYASCNRKQGSHLLLTAHPACSLHWMSQALIDIAVATAVAADMSLMSHRGDDIAKPL